MTSRWWVDEDSLDPSPGSFFSPRSYVLLFLKYSNLIKQAFLPSCVLTIFWVYILLWPIRLIVDIILIFDTINIGINYYTFSPSFKLISCSYGNRNMRL